MDQDAVAESLALFAARCGDPAAVVAYAIANVLPLTVHVVGSPGLVVTP